MRNILLTMVMLLNISNYTLGQHTQSVISVESRAGYSTNTYLNPFFAEWNTSVESGYGVISLMGQSIWYQNRNLIEVSGGLVFEPFLGDQKVWAGGLGLARYQRRFSGRFTGGLEAGASYFSSTYDRRMVWAQPYVVWSPSSFTLVRLKMGPHLRSYRNFADSLNTFANQGTNLYALEFETWPSFHWRLSAGLYGPLKTIPSIGNGFSSALSAGYLFRNGAGVRLRLGLQQYNVTVTSDPGGNGNFPPVGPPRETVQIQTETDRIFQVGLTGNYPVNRRWSLFARADLMTHRSTSTGGGFGDVNLSGGVRFTFEPSIGKRGNRTVLPEWEKKTGGQTLRIHYKGEGRLYLTGDFTNWEQPGIPLTEQAQNTYVAELDLKPGAYEYKVYRISGTSEEWVEFSDEIYTIDDGFGGKNALLLVEY